MKRAAVWFGLAALCALVAWGAWLILAGEKHLLAGSPDGNGSYVSVEEGEYYRIEIKVPERTPLRSALRSEADERARLAMESALQKFALDFKRDSGVEAIGEEEKKWMAGRQYEFAAAYQEFTSDRFISYRFDLYQDTGGAHPNGFYRTVV